MVLACTDYGIEQNSALTKKVWFSTQNRVIMALRASALSMHMQDYSADQEEGRVVHTDFIANIE